MVEQVDELARQGVVSFGQTRCASLSMPSSNTTAVVAVAPKPPRATNRFPVVVVTGLVLLHPTYRMAPLVLAAAATAVLVPLAFFPSSKTLWTAIDLIMRPLEPGEARPQIDRS